jgi:proline iminopeptidase
MHYVSTVTEKDWKYQQPVQCSNGWLQPSVVTLHKIYWEEYGNPKGEPVMFVHGGPGGGTAPVMARFFDPKRYRIILFDQRGCGKSTPNASDNNPTAALTDNTTAHLINDMQQLREALGITGKMHVFGGSWGSTLALAYAIAHPETVQTLILRGIFLCRRKDLDYFYQGNAAMYDKNPQDVSLPGTYQCYPEAWKNYVEAIEASERGDMIKAYAKLFAKNPANEKEAGQLVAAAKAWSVWEGITSYLAPEPSAVDKFADPDFAKAFARIENHYFMNGAFLSGIGEGNRNQNYILSNVDKIKNIPVHIVHGRYDLVCPLFQAEDLVAALRSVGASNIAYRITPASHSMMERENALALTDIMDTLPPMK